MPLVERRRDVAQSGSAPEWGSGGRGFKSRRPDVFKLFIGTALAIGPGHDGLGLIAAGYSPGTHDENFRQQSR